MRAESQRPQLPPQHIYLYICQEGATNANPQPEAGPRVRLLPQLSPAHTRFQGMVGGRKRCPRQQSSRVPRRKRLALRRPRMLRGSHSRLLSGGCPLDRIRPMFLRTSRPVRGAAPPYGRADHSLRHTQPIVGNHGAEQAQLPALRSGSCPH